MPAKSPPGARYLASLFLAFAALAAPALADEPATTTKASKMDCGKMKEKLTGEFKDLMTSSDQIQERCQKNALAWANIENGDKKDGGACESTYVSINNYGKQLMTKADEVCKIVEEAKAIEASCTEGQASCVKAQAAKDRAAAAKLQEISALLKKAKSEFDKRKAADIKVAQAYKKVIDDLQKRTKGLDQAALLNALSSYNQTATVFGPGVPNGLQMFSSQGWSGSITQADVDRTFDGYNAAWPKGWDQPQDTAQWPDGTKALAQAPPPSTTQWPDPKTAPQGTITGLDKPSSVPYFAQMPPTMVQQQLPPSPSRNPAPVSTTGASSPLGYYTLEIKAATDAASHAIEYTKVTVPKIESISNTFSSHADTLTGRGDNLGSIGDGITTHPGSTLSGVRNAADTLESTTGRSHAPSELAGGAAGSSSPGLSGASSTGPGLSRPADGSLGDAVAPGGGGNSGRRSSANRGGATGDDAEASATGSAGVAEKAAKAVDGDGELPGSFGTLGAVNVGGEEHELLAIARGLSAAKSAKGTAGGGTYVAAGSGAGKGGSKENGKDGAKGDEEALKLAGGLAGGPHGAAEPAEFDYKHGDVTSLRELLRRRLAERARSGGDADASVAAEEVLESARGGRGLASFGDPRVEGEGDSERAGPQPMESEPLFQRVHKAHKRYQQRAFPRQAGI